jgi:uncharacterized protein YktA (UPF0223 family)
MNIIGNSVKDDVVVLAGCEFKRAKNGLDETQVTSFINELVQQRDKLAESQDHLASLNRLAERTIVEADKLAKQIKTEASEQAKADSAAIVDKAKEQARQMVEKKVAEAVRLADEEAAAIKAKAEQEAALQLENQKSKIQRELRDLVNQQSGYLLEELERLKEQAASIQADFDNGAPKFMEEESAASAGIAQEKDAPPEDLSGQSNAMAEEVSDTARDQVPQQPEPVWQPKEVSEEEEGDY